MTVVELKLRLTLHLFGPVAVLLLSLLNGEEENPSSAGPSDS